MIKKLFGKLLKQKNKIETEADLLKDAIKTF